MKENFKNLPLCRKVIIRGFTLLELIVSLAAMTLLMTVAMSFFSSAQQLWRTAEQRSILFSDARLALDLFSQDLTNIRYSNETSNYRGVFPVWLQARPLSDFGNPSLLSFDPIKPYLASNHIPQVNFISSTDARPNRDSSSICEIRWSFLPPRDDVNPASRESRDYKYSVNGKTIETPGAALIRSCTTDYSDNSLTGESNSRFQLKTYEDGASGTKNALWNFSYFPARYNDGATREYVKERVLDIFSDRSSAAFKVVINGVLSCKIRFYTFDKNRLSNTGDLPSNSVYEIQAMDSSGNGVKSSEEGTYQNSKIEVWNVGARQNESFGADSIFQVVDGFGLFGGTPYPAIVRIELTMMGEYDLEEFWELVTDGREKQAEQMYYDRARFFSKTIYMPKLEN